MMAKGIIQENESIFKNVVVTILLIVILIFAGAFILVHRGMTWHDSLYESFHLITHIPDVNYHSFWITFLSIAGAFLGIYLIFIFISIVYSGGLHQEMKEDMKMKRINQLKNHVIICGANIVGSNIATRLDAHNKDFVVVGEDKEILKELSEKKNLVLEGNPLNEKVLKEAGIDRAGILLAVLKNSGDNILLTLIAKKLNPKIKVVARSSDYKYVEHLENIGADLVMMPEVLGAFKIADVAKDILEM